MDTVPGGSTPAAKGTRKLIRMVGFGMAVSVLVASTGMATEDQLLGFKVKDAGTTSIGLSGANVTNQQYGMIGQSCTTKLKSSFLLVQGDSSGTTSGGGPAGKFLCYKAKCASTSLSSVQGSDAFTSAMLGKITPKLYCLPFVDTTAPRYVDNGDETVSDTQTGLMWEQKDNLDGTVNSADPHDADNVYTWSTGTNKPDGTAYTDFLGALNGDGVATTGCFANHCDWRLPTDEELSAIVDMTQGQCSGGSGACISSAFGATQAFKYWSATTDSVVPAYAWYVNFTNGDVVATSKLTNGVYVRAVRGGV